MRILSIDTSTMLSEVTILEDKYIICDYSMNQEKTHSESLVPMIEEVLSSQKLTIKDIDNIAISLGPGSFTGLRIGLTIAKTLCQFSNANLIGISTLEALAYGIYAKDRLVVPLIDARGRNVFFSGYYNGELILKEGMIKIDKLIENLKDKNPIFVGDCSQMYLDELSAIGDVASPNFNNCIGRNICVLAEKRARKNDFDDIFTLSPNYLRKSQAEIDFKKRVKNG